MICIVYHILRVLCIKIVIFRFAYVYLSRGKRKECPDQVANEAHRKGGGASAADGVLADGRPLIRFELRDPAAGAVGFKLPSVIRALDAARGGIDSALRQRRQAVRANVSHDGPGRAVAPHCELDADDFDTNWHVADQALGRSDRQPCSVLTVICLDRFGLNTGNSGG